MTQKGKFSGKTKQELADRKAVRRNAKHITGRLSGNSSDRRKQMRIVEREVRADERSHCSA